MRIRTWMSALLGCSALAAAGAAESSPPQLREVEVDGRAVPGALAQDGRPAAIGIPSGRVTLRFGAGERGSASARRCRYKLEGRDDGWRETTAPMRLVVVLYDAQNDFLAEAPFLVTGESPGWSGSARASPLMARRETVTVPERAENLLLF
jgi:hypothetical protein